MAIFVAILAPGAALAAPITVYGGLPSIEFVEISPNGGRLALVKSDGRRHVLEIVNADGQGRAKVMNIGEAKLRGIMWAGERHLIVLFSVTGRIPDTNSSTGEWFLGEDFNLVKNNVRPLQGLARSHSSPALNPEPYSKIPLVRARIARSSSVGRHAFEHGGPQALPAFSDHAFDALSAAKSFPSDPARAPYDELKTL